uniref:hypothetical protein n=1 Tax=Streptomyces sp. NRRL F-5135 TaxID=1463858 RepID=UPI0018FE12BC
MADTTTATVTVHAPTGENAGQWAQTIADHVRAEYGDSMRLDIHIGTPAAGAELERVRERLAHAEAELDRLHNGESADAAAGSYAGRAEQAEARVRELEKELADADAEADALADHSDRTCEAVIARDRAEAAIARVRRLCEMTIACSVRVHAVQQAHDILAILDGTGQPDPLK